MYFCKMNRILLDVAGLTFSNSQSGAYALILSEKGVPTRARLPIIIGEAEAQSIAIAIEGTGTKRPLTHDLFTSFARNFNIEITEVVISRFKEGLFFSELHCLQGGEESIIDARTSDAIAIALRFKCPIYTNPQVMEEAGIEINEDEIQNDTTNNDERQELEEYEIYELEEMLHNAIEEEDYATASLLRDEINRRKF